MKVVALTQKVKEQYHALFEKVINAMKDYKANGDIEKFKGVLYEVIDETPNVAFIDPDMLYASYDLDYDESQWCEFDEEENKYSQDALKDIVADYDEFQSCQLTISSSGSILITLFGDAFYELYNK